MISIIVPVYGAEKYLKYCIDSLLAQTYRDFELILVDDGSPDGSGAICDAYAARDSRIRVIHKSNGGVSSARNAGLETAQGTYIVFVDSDDYVEPEYAAALLAAKEAEPAAEHVWCRFQTVTGYHHEHAEAGPMPGGETVLFDRADIMTLHELWLDAGPCCKLYRRSLIEEKHLRFDESLSLGEDLLFNLAYLDAAPGTSVRVLTKPLYNYVRTGGDSLDSRYRPDMLEIYRRVNDALLECLLKWQVSEEQMQKFYTSRYYSYDKVMRNNLKAPDRRRSESIRINSRLIRSREFQEVLAQTDCYLHPLYRAAYRIGSFRLILITDALAARFGRGRKNK